MDKLKLKQDIEQVLIANLVDVGPKCIVAQYLTDCLDVYINARRALDQWNYYGYNNSSSRITMGDLGITVMGGLVIEEFSTEPIDKPRGSE